MADERGNSVVQPLAKISKKQKVYKRPPAIEEEIASISPALTRSLWARGLRASEAPDPRIPHPQLQAKPSYTAI